MERGRGARARGNGAQRIDHGADVGRSGAAAAPHNVDQARLRKLAHEACSDGRGLVVAAHGVGQARVGVADREQCCAGHVSREKKEEMKLKSDVQKRKTKLIEGEITTNARVKRASSWM